MVEVFSSGCQLNVETRIIQEKRIGRRNGIQALVDGGVTEVMDVGLLLRRLLLPLWRAALRIVPP